MMERVWFTEELDMSRIIYGMWRLADDADTSARNVQAKIEACLEQGITTFDQADIYGDYQSQAVMGNALRQSPHLRERMEIITKCDIALISSKFAGRRVKHYDTSRSHIVASVETSLKEMAIERIDMLLIHRPDPLMDHHETGATLDRLVKDGKIRSVGVSNFRSWDWDLLQSAMTTPLVTNQIELSLLETSSFSNGDIAFLQMKGVAPMAWSPLGGGALFDRSNTRLEALRGALNRIAAAQGATMEAVAVAWLLKHPVRILPVMGTNNLERIKTLSDAARISLDRETWFELLELATGREVA